MKRKRDEFKLNKSKFISYPKTNLLKLGILLILLILVTIGFIRISNAKYKKTVDIGTIDITVDTALQLTYTLSTTDYTTDNVIIYVTPNHKKHKDYEEYGIEILEELENNIEDPDELLEAKESLLLEGINYYDTQEEWWSGEGFDTLQDFVDYINDNEDYECADIYEYMRDYNGNDESDSDEKVLDDFLLYSGDYYIKPEKYINTYAYFQITMPNGTTTYGYPYIRSQYKVNKSGNYTFQLENGLGDKTSITVSIDNIVDELYSDIYEQTTIYTDINGKTAWIPEGFAVGVTQVIDEIDEGLVITDKVDENGFSIGNEFVWIPVAYTKTNQDADGNGLDDGFETVFKRNGYDEATDVEPFLDGYTTPDGKTEEDEYYEMMLSVQEHGGFYVGRYEAGLKQGEGHRTLSTTGTIDKVVVQRDCYPYTYVGWGNRMDDYEEMVIYNNDSQDQVDGIDRGKGAVLLSKELYGTKEKQEKYGVISSLCYGVQWDAMLKFVEQSGFDINKSKAWGNYRDNSWRVERLTAKYSEDNGETWKAITTYKNKSTGQTFLLTTGASSQFKANNIFDIAGNVFEWTMEVNSLRYRTARAGSHTSYGDLVPASKRFTSYTPYRAFYWLGFRPTLYLK